MDIMTKESLGSSLEFDYTLDMRNFFESYVEIMIFRNH